MADINIYGTLHAQTGDGIIARANQIQDAELNKSQSQINKEQTQLIPLIQGVSDDSNAYSDPFIQLGHQDGWAGLNETLDSLFEGNSDKWNGTVRLDVSGMRIELKMWAIHYVNKVWTQSVTGQIRVVDGKLAAGQDGKIHSFQRHNSGLHPITQRADITDWVEVGEAPDLSGYLPLTGGNLTGALQYQSFYAIASAGGFLSFGDVGAPLQLRFTGNPSSGKYQGLRLVTQSLIATVFDTQNLPNTDIKFIGNTADSNDYIGLNIDKVKLTYSGGVALTDEQLSSTYDHAPNNTLAAIGMLRSLDNGIRTSLTATLSTLMDKKIEDFHKQYLISLYTNAGIRDANGNNVATYDATTDRFSLNGLTDLTFDDMAVIYRDGLTLMPHLGEGHNYTGKTNFCNDTRSKVGGNEVINANPRAYFALLYSGSLVVLNLGAGVTMNNGSTVIQNNCYGFCGDCTKLTTVLGVLNVKYIKGLTISYAKSFRRCYQLQEVRIKGLGTDYHLATSPLISLASLQYLVENADTVSTPKTVEVHATTYDRMNNPENYDDIPEADREAWKQLIPDITAKGFTFVVPE